MQLHTIRRAAVATLATALVATGAVAAAPSPSGAGAPAAQAPKPAVQAVLDWKVNAIDAAFVDTQPATAPPVAALYLGFTSLAVHDAVEESLRRSAASEVAAVAQAAHDVLWEYFPMARTNLDADLTASLADVPAGPPKARGIRIGREAAADMIASRVGDGRFDASVVYQKPAGPGVWQPANPSAPGGGMALAWVAFVDPLVLDDPVQVDGPDALGSAAYAADFEEVKTVGRDTTAARTADQAAIASFYHASSTRMYTEALCRVLQAEPLGLKDTVDLFAVADASVADAFIQTWRLKFDLGFWRPFQAIAGAASDGNDATTPVPAGETWAPLIPNPAYSDYVSGHSAATSPFMEAVRLMLGDDTALRLEQPNGAWRSYETISALESDALNARIWGGLHFRDAMDDGYFLGHTTARRVWDELR